MIKGWKIWNLLAALAVTVVVLGACGRAGDNEPPPDVAPNAEVLRKERDIHGHR